MNQRKQFLARRAERYRYWLFPRDPDLVARAGVNLDLYAGFWEGQRLGAADYVLSADEKSIQVLARLHPGLPPAPGQVQRVEFEYQRPTLGQSKTSRCTYRPC